MKRFYTCFLFLLALPLSSQADTIAVAVASNFKDTLNRLADGFESETGHVVQISAASTGKHYAQIRNGAPFELFFAADDQRPAMLEGEGLAVHGTRFVYATGRLTFWAPAGKGKDCLAELAAGNFLRLAIANPATAPYGVAAEQVIESLGLQQTYKGRIVMGENISQAMQFVDVGAATAGFVATSQWLANPRHDEGCAWEPGEDRFMPVRQEVQLLKHGESSQAARAFLAYVRSPAALEVIRADGYHAGN